MNSSCFTSTLYILLLIHYAMDRNKRNFSECTIKTSRTNDFLVFEFNNKVYVYKRKPKNQNSNLNFYKEFIKNILPSSEEL